MDDVKNGQLPQVSFIIDSYTKNYDEHPGFKTNIQTGMGIQQQLINALKTTKYWDKTQNSAAAYILTYDEHGGFFDHVVPPQLDAFGAGIRVPSWVISPYANTAGNTGTNGNRLVATSLPSEHSSILKFLETVFGLPTLASINHTFDFSTPGGRLSSIGQQGDRATSTSARRAYHYQRPHGNVFVLLA